MLMIVILWWWMEDQVTTENQLDFFFFWSKGRKDFKIGVKAGVKDCIGICYR